MSIDHYDIIETVSETRYSRISKATDRDSGKTVRVNFLKSKSPSPSDKARFLQDYATIKALDHDGIIRTEDVFEVDDGFYVIEEDVDGITLDSYLKTQRAETELFLVLAEKLSDTVGWLHKRGLVHYRISPATIIINPEKNSTKLTGFGISSLITGSQDDIYDPDHIRDILPYVSPEQTGRMNRSMDYRTDLYSLGVTFFHMVTGVPLFKSGDPLELIHSHIARIPQDPCFINPELPGMISDIILKLLAKPPEERYQNAFGLRSDLITCLSDFRASGEISEFQLGQRDIADRFIIPQKLYGREAEIRLLYSGYTSVCSGDPDVLLVTGASGIGKSALVNEIQKPVVASHGNIVTGKYEQYKQDTPYSAIIQAFKGFSRLILSENEAGILQWKETLLKHLGENSRVISEIIPEIGIITGRKPEPVRLGTEETKNRFNIAFETFVSCIATERHPLVLFLDDLQWVDFSSLELLEKLMLSKTIRYFYIICSYRMGEVDDTHHFREMIRRVEKHRPEISRINLGPITEEDVGSFLCDFLKSPVERAKPLARLVFRKTAGNPFFINQFMKTLYDERKLCLDPELGWQWDDMEIESMTVTDNVVDLLAGKISAQPDSIQETLKICACIGNRFDLETIAYTLDRPLDETLKDLLFSRDEGYIHITDDLFHFHHDRIQEAAYSLISDSDRARYHYRIGKRFHDRVSSTEDLHNKLFYIADQLNQGSTMIHEDPERVMLADLNYQAGLKAKGTAAYLAALKYFELAAGAVGSDAWLPETYELTLSVWNEVAETARLCGNYSLMDFYGAEVTRSAVSVLDQVTVYETWIAACFAKQDYSGAVHHGLTLMSKLGYRIPETAGKHHIVIEYLRLKGMLFGKHDDDILSIPEMSDPTYLAIARIMDIVGISAMFTNVTLYGLIILKRVVLTLKYGANAYTGMALVAYGGFLIFAFGDIRGGIRYGDLSLKFAARKGAGIIRAKVYGIYDAYIRHWKEDYVTCEKEIMTSYRFARESGDLIYTSMLLVFNDLYGIFSRRNFIEFRNDVSEHIKITRQCRQEPLIQLHSMVLQFVANLGRKDGDPLMLTGEFFNEEPTLQKWKKINNYGGLAMFHIVKTVLGVMFYRYDICREHILKFKTFEKMVRAQMVYHQFLYFSSIALLASLPTEPSYQRFRILRKVKHNLKTIRKWDACAPGNYTSWMCLIEAEYARAKGDLERAADNYEKASEGFSPVSALFRAITCERAGICFKAAGRNTIAGAYFGQAFNLYESIGVTAKTEHLKSFWGNSVTQGSQAGFSDPKETGTLHHGNLDLSTVMKSVRALSSEIDLVKVLRTILFVSMESAGAQRGVLILNRDGRFVVEAERNVDTGLVETLQALPVDTCEILSTQVVNYVARTRLPVIQSDATAGEFASDTYIIENHVKSLLAAPMMNKGLMTGIIYLENNLAPNVFTSERLELMEILSGNASIALENARLFESVKQAESEVRKLNVELEHRVEERTAELKDALEQIKQLANHDPLTGLVNRRGMYEMIRHEISRFRRNGKPFSLVLSDIDNFKMFNDSYGHDCGDYVLKSIAGIMKLHLRKHDSVARWGGEEFLFLLPETDADGALVATEKIRSRISEAGFEFNDLTLKVTMTFGVSEFNDDSRGVEHYLKEADSALYRGKKEGKNCVILSNVPG